MQSRSRMKRPFSGRSTKGTNLLRVDLSFDDCHCRFPLAAQREFNPVFPAIGLVCEHESADLCPALDDLSLRRWEKGRNRRTDIAAIGITNQRANNSGLELWQTVKRWANAIVWQTGARADVHDLREAGSRRICHAPTGLLRTRIFRNQA